MAPHLLTRLKNIHNPKERTLIQEQLTKSLFKDPQYPLIVVWIQEGGEVLHAYGGGVARLGFEKWREPKGLNAFKIYPQIQPHVKRCLGRHEPVFFDWTGKSPEGTEVWLKCYAVPMVCVDFSFVCGFAFDMSRYRYSADPEPPAFPKPNLQEHYLLTDAELAVCRLLALQGFRTKEIAKELGRSSKTVSAQLSSIRRKLGVQGKKSSLKELLRNVLKIV